MMMNNIEKARDRVKGNRFSLDAWNILINDAIEKNVIEESRTFFEELLGQFPSCGRFWKLYIEQELKFKNVDAAEKLYARCLSSVLNIDLWKSYLSFLKEYKNHKEDFNKIMIEAFDLSLKKVGLDVMSYSIWNDYINFLKSLEGTEKSKELLNKVFRKALNNPMINTEQIWKDYCSFKSIQIDESSKDFQNMKKISREFENVTRPLERHLPALPPGYSGNEEEESRQINAWKRYILWEKQNPLKLADQQDIMKRVLYAYEQSLLCLAYHPDFWHEASSYLYKKSKQLGESNKEKNSEENQLKLKEITENAAGNLYERSLKSFMKDNMLIHFAYADFEERRKNFKKVYEIYESCIQNMNIEPTLVWIQYIRFVKRNEDIAAARKLFKRAREDTRSTYHLFIANANLEYLCTKDKTIGFKIFHLGAKKYSNESEFMLAYLRYMSHLNEDNNTRVLFERILSSDELPAVKSNEIWTEFLKFECAVGDLASILKVDKKRQKTFEVLNNLNENSQNTLMIDRYRYLDLLPSSLNELKAMGYKDLPDSSGSNSYSLGSTSISANGTILNPSTTSSLKLSSLVSISNLSSIFSSNISLSQTELAAAAANEIRRMSVPVPDITQMLPFKPIRNPVPGLHSLAGGVFPFPPAVTELVKRLPPPVTFEGPFVKIDEFLNKFQSIEIVEDFQPLYVYMNGDPIQELEHLSNQGNLHKRPSVWDDEDDDIKKSKSMDIYKQRQYQKLKNTKP